MDTAWLRFPRIYRFSTDRSMKSRWLEMDQGKDGFLLLFLQKRSKSNYRPVQFQNKKRTNKQTFWNRPSTLQINSSHSFLQFALMASKRLILSTDHDRVIPPIPSARKRNRKEAANISTNYGFASPHGLSESSHADRSLPPSSPLNIFDESRECIGWNAFHFPLNEDWLIWSRPVRSIP